MADGQTMQSFDNCANTFCARAAAALPDPGAITPAENVSATIPVQAGHCRILAARHPGLTHWLDRFTKVGPEAMKLR